MADLFTAVNDTSKAADSDSSELHAQPVLNSQDLQHCLPDVVPKGYVMCLSGEGVDMTQRRRGPSPAPASVVAVWQINQIFNGLLLSGAADGAVRVWRDYTFPRTQRLATAWQVSAAHLVALTACCTRSTMPCPRGVSSRI